MPTCKKCHPVYDLGRICPHEGPGREVWERGREVGYDDAVRDYEPVIKELQDDDDRLIALITTLIKALREHADSPHPGDDMRTLAGLTEARLKEVTGDE